jgi:hypothetical protein
MELILEALSVHYLSNQSQAKQLFISVNAKELKTRLIAMALIPIINSIGRIVSFYPSLKKNNIKLNFY